MATKNTQVFPLDWYGGDLQKVITCLKAQLNNRDGLASSRFAMSVGAAERVIPLLKFHPTKKKLFMEARRIYPQCVQEGDEWDLMFEVTTSSYTCFLDEKQGGCIKYTTIKEKSFGPKLAELQKKLDNNELNYYLDEYFGKPVVTKLTPGKYLQFICNEEPTPQDITKFIKVCKAVATLFKPSIWDHVLHKGQDIIKAYAEDKAYKSCMVGSRAANVEIYAANPEIVSLMVINKDGCYKRALIWEPEGEKGPVYVDRIYPPEGVAGEATFLNTVHSVFTGRKITHLHPVRQSHKLCLKIKRGEEWRIPSIDTFSYPYTPLPAEQYDFFILATPACSDGDVKKMLDLPKDLRIKRMGMDTSGGPLYTNLCRCCNCGDLTKPPKSIIISPPAGDYELSRRVCKRCASNLKDQHKYLEVQNRDGLCDPMYAVPIKVKGEVQAYVDRRIKWETKDYKLITLDAYRGKYEYIPVDEESKVEAKVVTDDMFIFNVGNITIDWRDVIRVVQEVNGGVPVGA